MAQCFSVIGDKNSQKTPFYMIHRHLYRINTNRAGTKIGLAGALLTKNSPLTIQDTGHSTEVIQHVGCGTHVVWDRQKLSGAALEVGKNAAISADGQVQVSRVRRDALSR